jgi:Spy/CpxP family protein refolding chaperone
LGIGIQYAQTTSLYDGMIQGKLVELAVELTREGRLDSEETAKVSADRANLILKDIGALYGEFIQVRVAFMLEAKNVLTPEQKLHLLANLEPGALIDFDEIAFLQPEMFDLPIHLNMDQRKKLVKLEADLLVKEVKLERDIELVLLDLETVFMGDAIEPATVDKQIKKLAGLAADAIENRVDFVLDAKDVLTLDQKRLLSYLLGL